jgi:hypothetical protein
MPRKEKKRKHWMEFFGNLIKWYLLFFSYILSQLMKNVLMYSIFIPFHEAKAQGL